MARANLIITDALKEAFRAGLEGVDTRWIKAKLDNESITLENVGQVSEGRNHSQIEPNDSL